MGKTIRIDLTEKRISRGAMVDEYYKGMGWDRKTGRPFPDTLKAVGLEDIAEDLW